eukprot:6206277-Pleurochrysis_carterae.AAC.2
MYFEVFFGISKFYVGTSKFSCTSKCFRRNIARPRRAAVNGTAAQRGGASSRGAARTFTRA